MKLYLSPGACSLAPHILLRELGLSFLTESVNLKTGVQGGRPFSEINPKGYVPTLEIEQGVILTEVVVILQYLADMNPEAGLLPKEGLARYRCLEWAVYISTELHKGMSLLWSESAPSELKETIRAGLQKKLHLIDGALDSSEFLCGPDFTIADAYLFTVLRWTKFLKIELSGFKNLQPYLARLTQRPSVKAALTHESLKH